jgi:hypothetical protein
MWALLTAASDNVVQLQIRKLIAARELRYERQKFFLYLVHLPRGSIFGLASTLRPAQL